MKKSVYIMAMLAVIMLTSCSDEVVYSPQPPVLDQTELHEALGVKVPEDKNAGTLLNTVWGPQSTLVMNGRIQLTETGYDVKDFGIASSYVAPWGLKSVHECEPWNPRHVVQLDFGKTLITFDGLEVPFDADVKIQWVDESLNQVGYVIKDLIVVVTNFDSVNRCVEAGEAVRNGLLWDVAQETDDIQVFQGVLNNVPLFGVVDYSSQYHRYVSITPLANSDGKVDFASLTEQAQEVLTKYMVANKMPDMTWKETLVTDLEDLVLTLSDAKQCRLENYRWVLESYPLDSEFQSVLDGEAHSWKGRLLTELDSICDMRLFETVIGEESQYWLAHVDRERWRLVVQKRDGSACETKEIEGLIQSIQGVLP